MYRAFPGPEYYGGSAPAPGPISASARLARSCAGCARRGPDLGGFPCSRCFHSAGSAPDSAPTAMSVGTPQAFPTASRPRLNTADGSHRRHQLAPVSTANWPLSTRFEPAFNLRSFFHRFLLVRLSASLAGPAPSGSTGTSRRCQGCSHPDRPPKRRPRLPSASAPCCDREPGKAFHLPKETPRLMAHINIQPWHPDEIQESSHFTRQLDRHRKPSPPL